MFTLTSENRVHIGGQTWTNAACIVQHDRSACRLQIVYTENVNETNETQIQTKQCQRNSMKCSYTCSGDECKWTSCFFCVHSHWNTRLCTFALYSGKNAVHAISLVFCSAIYNRYIGVICAYLCESDVWPSRVNALRVLPSRRLAGICDILTFC